MAYADSEMKLVWSSGDWNLWVYLNTAADAIATLKGATYFGAKGSTSGTSDLNVGDVIIVPSSGGAILRVTDAAAGLAAQSIAGGEALDGVFAA